MGEEQSESLFAFHSLFAELVIRTETGWVGVECVGAIVEYNFEGIDSVAVLVKIVSEVHCFVDIINIKDLSLFYNSRK